MTAFEAYRIGRCCSVKSLDVHSVHVYIHTMSGAPLALSKASGVPFYRQLSEQLVDRIRSGVLPAGHPLPSIRELAAELTVSVITVKSAYEELESQGLIVSRQGRGTFVAEGATTMSKKHFESEIAREFVALAERAASVGLAQERVRALAEDAVRKAYKGKKHDEKRGLVT